MGLGVAKAVMPQGVLDHARSNHRVEVLTIVPWRLEGKLR